MTDHPDQLTQSHVDPGPDYRTGQGYRRDERMENLLRLRDTDPAAFRALGPRIALNVATYSEFKAAAERHGLLDRETKPTPPPADTLKGALYADLQRAGHLPPDTDQATTGSFYAS